MTAKEKAIREPDKKSLKEKLRVMQALKASIFERLQGASSEQQNHINDCIFQIESDIKFLDKIEKEFKFNRL